MTDLNETVEGVQKLQRDYDRAKTLLMAIYEQFNDQKGSTYSIGIDEMRMQYDFCENDFYGMMTDIETLFDMDSD